jgi:cysteinyl-tRNA synthetase
MTLKLYNTLTRQKEEFKPITPGKVKIYSCGPTVYSRMHLGNIRAYAEWDILHRALLFLGYDVERYINFTDVGHMTADEDFGEDKMEAKSREEGKTPKEVSDFYIDTVIDDFKRLNYLHPNGEKVEGDITPEETVNYNWLRASLHVEDMISYVKEIMENGYAYETDQAVYFDVSKYPDYTRLSGQRLEDKLIAVRDDVDLDPSKKQPADFVLWMKRVGKYENHLQYWNSPWGDGFPGWHIECTAMGCESLGDHFDIHTGGVDHIPVHHQNEMAQNFGYYKHAVVNTWMHNEFITRTDGGKMSKSAGDLENLESLEKDGFSPMDLRYQLISVNYRQPMSINAEVLTAAQKARLKIVGKAKGWDSLDSENTRGAIIDSYLSEFKEAIQDDLNMSKALSVVFKMLSDSDNSGEDLLMTLFLLDEVLGLDIENEISVVNQEDTSDIPVEINELAQKRAEARVNKDFELADKYRDEIVEAGYVVLDTPDGWDVKKK